VAWRTGLAACRPKCLIKQVQVYSTWWTRWKLAAQQIKFCVKFTSSDNVDLQSVDKHYTSSWRWLLPVLLYYLFSTCHRYCFRTARGLILFAIISIVVCFVFNLDTMFVILCRFVKVILYQYVLFWHMCCYVMTVLVCLVTQWIGDKWNIWLSGWTMGVQFAGYFPLVWPCFSTGN